MKKLLLMAAAALVASSAWAQVTIDTSKNYLLKVANESATTDVYLNMTEPRTTPTGTGTKTEPNATIREEGDVVTFEETATDGNYKIKCVSTEKYLGATIWNTIYNDESGVEWTAALIDSYDTENQVISLYQKATVYPGYMGLDNWIAGEMLYADKSGAKVVHFELIPQSTEVEEITDEEALAKFQDGISALKTTAQNFALLKNVIDGEDVPEISEEGITAANYKTRIKEANKTLQAYVKKFNNKHVYMYSAHKNAYIGVIPSTGSNHIKEVASKDGNDLAVWHMVVNSDNKILFYNLVTGLCMNGSATTPQASGDYVAFKLDMGWYLNIYDGDMTIYSNISDSGSKFSLEPATYTFAEAEVSTLEEPKWFHILSDRLICNHANPNHGSTETIYPLLSVTGESGTTGEAVSHDKYGALGSYWCFIPGDTEGSVKVVNFLDGYAMGKGSSNKLVQAEVADAQEFYLIQVGDQDKWNLPEYTVKNTYAFSTNADMSGNCCLTTMKDYSYELNRWTASGDRRGGLDFEDTFNNQNYGEGCAYYLLAATDEELAYIETQKITLDKAISEFENQTAANKALAEQFALLKGAIGGEEAPVYSTDDVTTTNYKSQISTANKAYQAYVKKFNNKFVRLHNEGLNKDLALVHKAGANHINFATEENDNSVWHMIVTSDNAVRFYSLTSGLAAWGADATPVASGDFVAFKVGGMYLNGYEEDGVTEDLMTYTNIADAGSQWSITAAEYVFDAPEVSSLESPKWYHILSDRLITNHANPNHNTTADVYPQLSITAESGEAGEQVGNGAYGNAGSLWCFIPGEAEGSVKVVNLLDNYAWSSNEDVLVQGEVADAEDLWLINVGDQDTWNLSEYFVKNTYAIATNATMDGYCCLTTLKDFSHKLNTWTASGDHRGNLEFEDTFGNQNYGEGCAFYFLAATDDVVAEATEAAIAKLGGVSAPVDDTEALTALLGEEAVADYVVALAEASALDVTTIYGARQAAAATAKVEEAVNSHLSALAGQPIQAATDGKYLTVDSNLELGLADSGADIATVWTADEQLNLTNMDQQFMTLYVNLAYNAAEGAFVISDKEETAGGDGEDGIAAQSEEGTYFWTLERLTEGVEVAVAIVDGNLIVTLPEGVSVNEGAKSRDLAITLTKGEETAEVKASAFQGSEASVATTLTGGKYTVSIPAGFVTLASGKPNLASESVADVEESGISEIYLDSDTTVYDLQGRRIAKPIHGINIINGRKVMVK